jgi:DNA-binding beta-propeller fold protein YncE
MKLKQIVYSGFILASAVVFQTCRQDDPVIENAGYPNAIGKIMETKCAVAGCHNAQSAGATSGLDLTNWNTMFLGDRTGNSVTIPFSHQFSTTFLFTNTYTDLGVSTIRPTMPVNNTPLTRNEEIILRDWIDEGAPDRNGFVKFSDNPNRKKFYVINQGCDVVTVFDEASLLPMRYIHIGTDPSHDAPHEVKVSPDGQYWYVCFLGYPYLQKYRTSDDSYAGQVYLGYDSYNTFTITNDSKKAFIAGFNAGLLDEIDLTTMTTMDTLNIGQTYMHSVQLNPANNALYITVSNGNYILKLTPAISSFGSYTTVELDGTQIPSSAPAHRMDPHDMIFSPDGSKYFVTCQTSNEVIIMKASNDSLLKRIQLPPFSKPQDLSVSSTTNLLFVTCSEDTITFPGIRGSVFPVDMGSNQLLTPINVGFQPHGISVDDEKGFVYVANRNINPNGPAPHHTTDCGGRNGYLTFIDLGTLKLLPGRKVELASDPYSISIKH